MAGVGHRRPIRHPAAERPGCLLGHGHYSCTELHSLPFPWPDTATRQYAGLVRVQRRCLRQLCPRRSSNREGGPSALAAAITGRTARYGYLLDEPRLAGVIVEVHCPVRTVADFGALSYLVGKAVGEGVPWFADLAAWLPPLPSDLTFGGPAVDRLKTMGAGLAAYGAVALYHIAGYTPEARDFGERLLAPSARRMAITSLDEAYCAMDADPDLGHIDLVAIGCPHASLAEIAEVAAYLKRPEAGHTSLGHYGRNHAPTCRPAPAT